MKSGQHNIFVNTRLLIKDKLDGIGWFTNETLQRITTQHPEHHFIFAFDRKPDPSFIFADNVTAVTIFPQTRRPFLYKIWFQYSIPLVLKKIKPDLFLSPDGFLPLSLNIPSIAVIHDINFEHYPNDLQKNYSNYYRKYFPQFAQKATRLATVSEFSKQDIVSNYKISPDKIDVVYNGVNEVYQPVSSDEQQKVKSKYTSGDDYFIFVSSMHPRKNLANLFKAFSLFKQKTSSPMKLVVVGKKQWWNDEIDMAYRMIENKDEVIFTGRLEPDELNKVLGTAFALTYVSYFEGFGIPIIEAFACNTPVITSAVTSMPEVAGDAALLVDPFSSDSICEGMIKMTSDHTYREALIRKGAERHKIFTWQKSADRLWDCVSKTISV